MLLGAAGGMARFMMSRLHKGCPLKDQQNIFINDIHWRSRELEGEDLLRVCHETVTSATAFYGKRTVPAAARTRYTHAPATPYTLLREPM